MLTPEEEAEFTHLNCLAFDLARMKATKEDVIIPMWLCMSTNAKDRYRAEAIDSINTMVASVVDKFDPNGDSPSVTVTNENAEQILCRLTTEWKDLIQRWRAMEVEAKKARDAGNPRAFFCG